MLSPREIFDASFLFLLLLDALRDRSDDLLELETDSKIVATELIPQHFNPVFTRESSHVFIIKWYVIMIPQGKPKTNLEELAKETSKELRKVAKRMSMYRNIWKNLS